MNFCRRIVFEELLEPDDTYHIKLRKVVLAVGLICSLPILAASISSARRGESPRAIASTLATFSISFAFMGTWAVCRYTKRAGDNLMSLSLGHLEFRRDCHTFYLTRFTLTADLHCDCHLCYYD